MAAERIARTAMNVGRNGVGRTALRNGGFGHGVIETAATVADVEDHATLLGRKHRRDEVAILHDIGEGAGRIGRAGIGIGR
jgi:hypothetical protein